MMKSKVGNFFFAFVPFVLVYVLFYFAWVPGTGLYVIYKFLTEGGEGLGSFLQYFIFEGFAAMSDEMYYEYAYFSQFIFALMGIVIFGFWCRIFHGRKVTGNVFTHVIKSFSWQILVAILLLWVGIYYLTDLILVIESVVFPNMLDAYNEAVGSMDTTENFVLTTFLYSSVFGPICEELVFRGAIYGHLKKALPVWLAMILQGVLFGVYHMDLLQGIYATVMGIVMAIIYEKGGSIVHCSLLHILFNLAGLSAFLPEFADKDWCALFIIGCAIVFTTAGLWLYLYGVKKRDNGIYASSRSY